MLRRLWITTAVLIAVLALAGAALARVPAGFVGMVITDPVFPAPDQGPTVDLGSQLSSMVGAGVETVRVVFNWSAAQPYQSFSDVPADQRSQFTDIGGVPTTFSQLDPIVALAAQRRLRLLPVVLYAPGWDAASHPDGTYANPASTGPYAAFLTALIARYGPQGSFWATHSPKLPVRSWQVWNEPNIKVFWAEQPFQPGYVTLLRASHDAIKRADPGAKVVLAGMPNYSWSALRGIYRLGARRLFDVVAVHPYTRTPAGVISILTKVRRVMNAAGDRRKGIIADEISWPSSQGQTIHSQGFDFTTTRAGQARDLAQLLPMLGRDRAKLGLIGFDYYTWAGIEDRGGYSFDFSGLFRIHGARLSVKPAFYSFKHAALTLESCRTKGALATVCRRRS